ncbi:MAG: hypothetical protein IKW59_09305 [Clostridia bacterium]|nr:hypothetical protein [Clostridia bacterium]
MKSLRAKRFHTENLQQMKKQRLKNRTLMKETVMQYEETSEKTQELDFFNLPYKTLSVKKKNEVCLTDE